MGDAVKAEVVQGVAGVVQAAHGHQGPCKAEHQRRVLGERGGGGGLGAWHPHAGREALCGNVCPVCGMTG